MDHFNKGPNDFAERFAVSFIMLLALLIISRVWAEIRF